MYEKHVRAFLKHIGAEAGLFPHDQAIELLTMAINALIFRGTRGYSYQRFCFFFSSALSLEQEEAQTIFAQYGDYFRHEADAEKTARVLRSISRWKSLSHYDALCYTAGHIRRKIRECGKLNENDERRHIASFTGPRPEKLGDINIGWLLLELNAEIRRTVLDGFDTFYVGMSRGIDMAAARLVLNMKKEHRNIKLHCALPFEGQQNKWNRQDRKEYDLLLKQADKVETVSMTANTGAYLARNQFMVDRSDRLIAVYDGSSGGGTGFTTAYGEKLGADVVYIDPRAFRQT